MPNCKALIRVLLLGAAGSLFSGSPGKMPAIRLPYAGDTFYSPGQPVFMPARNVSLKPDWAEPGTDHFSEPLPTETPRPPPEARPPDPDATVNAALEKIIRKERAGDPPAGTPAGGRMPETPLTEDRTAREAAKLLRFRVNGKDLLGDLRGIAFSAQGEGALLVTGERKFTAGTQVYTETFYLLARPGTVTAGEALYDAAIAVTPRRKESPLGRFSAPLEAFRTGSFVTLRGKAENADLDILIDLGGQP